MKVYRKKKYTLNGGGIDWWYLEWSKQEKHIEVFCIRQKVNYAWDSTFKLFYWANAWCQLMLTSCISSEEENIPYLRKCAQKERNINDGPKLLEDTAD